MFKKFPKLVPEKLSAAYLVTASIIFMMFLIVTFGTFYQIDQGERGVLLRNGKLSSVAEPGLGFKFPMIESVRRISVRDHVQSMKLEAYSFDQQPAEMVVSVTYRVPVDRVSDLYSEYGALETCSGGLRRSGRFRNVRN